MKHTKKEKKIAVIGLGYVGLPLAVEFGKCFDVLGFDTNHKRVDELKGGVDSTLEVERKPFFLSPSIYLSANLFRCHIVIIAMHDACHVISSLNLGLCMI